MTELGITDLTAVPISVVADDINTTIAVIREGNFTTINMQDDNSKQTGRSIITLT